MDVDAMDLDAEDDLNQKGCLRKKFKALTLEAKDEQKPKENLQEDFEALDLSSRYAQLSRHWHQ